MKLTSHRLPVWTLPFILSLAQVYPAFGACLCAHETPEPAELSADAGTTPACHAAPDQADARVEVAPDSTCSSGDVEPAGTELQISCNDCCEALIGWTPPALASVSRAMEIRSGFDAISWDLARGSISPFPRLEGLSPAPELSTLTRNHPTLYLINVSLLM